MQLVMMSHGTSNLQAVMKNAAILGKHKSPQQRNILGHMTTGTSPSDL